MKTQDIIKNLKKIVGADWVRTDDLSRYHFGSDVLTYFGQGALYPENHPLMIVMPESTKHVQAVIRFAGKNNIPLYAIGGGTVLLIGSIPGKPDVGITFDFHRMQNVTLDKERMVVRAQPGATGLQVSQLVRSMNIGYRPYFGGSPGTSLFVPYQVFTGQNKMAGYSDGMGINCATGMEMVLPNGEVIRTGSMANPKAPAWPHGPGPALTYLPFFSNAGYGIVTQMEFRLFPTPQEIGSLWVTFKTLHEACEAMNALIRSEYACGATVMGPGCWTHCLYSSQHWQEGAHFVKATQDINLIGLSFRGSKNKVAYERRACIRLLEKHGGTVMPDWMVAILDGHEANAAGWQQCNSPKICGTFNGKSDSGGIFVSGGVFDTMEKLEIYMREGMKEYQDVCKNNPEFLNHPHPIIRLYASCGQTYLSMGGHANAAGEVIFVLDFASRQFLPMIGEIKARFDKLMKSIGMAPLGVGRDSRTWTECPDHFAMAKIIKRVLDPKEIMAPGVAFPLSQ
ncbi:MAG: FAD-binding oxidoreductase [Desulfobacterota bacterium]|nr:FAD-binding oxidoreductase [Thermodesulfobacteriota bacterium]